MQYYHLYLSHPEVRIDPSLDIASWSLSEVGARRVDALAASDALNGFDMVVSSAETKAVETAAPLARRIGCAHVTRKAMHENDRTATGFLPPQEFEATADRFFQRPAESTRGWETANAAQARIVREVHACLAQAPKRRMLFVGHGAVGTLLYCHLADLPISRVYDQRNGGGCFFEFETIEGPPNASWQPMENLHDQSPRS